MTIIRKINKEFKNNLKGLKKLSIVRFKKYNLLIKKKLVILFTLRFISIALRCANSPLFIVEIRKMHYVLRYKM